MRVLEIIACYTHSDALFSASSRNRSDLMHNAICETDSFATQTMLSSNCALLHITSFQFYKINRLNLKKTQLMRRSHKSNTKF